MSGQEAKPTLGPAAYERGPDLSPLGVLAETSSSEHLGPKTPTHRTTEQLRGDLGLRGDTL